jgi:hypothetical protein
LQETLFFSAVWAINGKANGGLLSLAEITSSILVILCLRWTQIRLKKCLSRFEYHLVVDGEEFIHEEPSSVCALFSAIPVCQQPLSINILDGAVQSA